MNELPRILIVDDILGRRVPSGQNEERVAYCVQHRLRDVTGDAVVAQTISSPIADAVFLRGQFPECAAIGDVVENALGVITESVEQGWHSDSAQHPWSLVLVDLCFYTGTVTVGSNNRLSGVPRGRPSDAEPPHYFGLEVLETLRRRFPDLPIVMMSSMPREPVTRSFAVLGADGFIDKNLDDRGPGIAEQLQRHGLIGDSEQAIVGSSRSLLRVLRAARRLAAASGNILIHGERGTGKELFAHYVHDHGIESSKRPFVTLDSGVLTPELYASTLFGHRKGAFTGADHNRTGLIVEADNGDLFLDEVGNMPMPVQIGLLRVIEYRRVTPLGASQAEGRDVKVRFVSATNADLDRMCGLGTFREDLHDRFREGGTLILPPLRERVEDIPSLAEHFLRRAEAATAGARARELDKAAIEVLQAQDWPGNIRELKNCIFKAVSSYPDTDHLLVHHLELASAPPRPPQTQAVLVDVTKDSVPTITDLLRIFKQIDFAAMSPSELAGRLNELESEWARLMAEYLTAALVVTKKPTPDNPDGNIHVQPAVRLMSGDNALKAYQAYDIIKRLLAIDPAAISDLLQAPILRDTLERASQRRSKGKSRSSRKLVNDET